MFSFKQKLARVAEKASDVNLSQKESKCCYLDFEALQLNALAVAAAFIFFKYNI